MLFGFLACRARTVVAIVTPVCPPFGNFFSKVAAMVSSAFASTLRPSAAFDFARLRHALISVRS